MCSNPQATDNTLILQQPNIPGLRTVHLIDWIAEKECAKVLLQISCTMLHGPLRGYIYQNIYFKQISIYYNAMNPNQNE